MEERKKVILFRKKQEKENWFINMEIKRKQMNYYWRRFTELVEISYHYDKNSQEYENINKMTWKCFDRWSALFLAGYTETESEMKNDSI